jgi:hypothetical protein
LYLRPTVRANGLADLGEQQTQIVVDLCGGSHRRARVFNGVDLLDGDGGRNPFHAVDVRLLDTLQELTGIGRKRLHIAAVALGINGIEGQRGFASATQAGDDGQRPTRQVKVEVLQIVGARPSNDEMLAQGGSSPRR